MLYSLKDFRDIIFGGRLGMRTISGATPEAGIRKSWLFTQHEIFDWSPPTKLQFMDAKGKIKWLNAAIESQFGVGDMPFREKF